MYIFNFHPIFFINISILYLLPVIESTSFQPLRRRRRNYTIPLSAPALDVETPRILTLSTRPSGTLTLTAETTLNPKVSKYVEKLKIARKLALNRKEFDESDVGNGNGRRQGIRTRRRRIGLRQRDRGRDRNRDDDGERDRGRNRNRDEDGERDRVTTLSTSTEEEITSVKKCATYGLIIVPDYFYYVVLMYFVATVLRLF